MLNILYEDNHIIVAVKPKGVLSQADGKDLPDMLSLLKEYIKEKYNKPGNVYLGLVHRLDTNTSGVMVFARTSKAAARLSESIREHQFEKRYLATVEGTLSGDSKILRHLLIKDEKEKKSNENPKGQEAILEYTPIRSYDILGTKVTDVDILLKTGRFHQIRSQMSIIGHPLYGDRKYGSKNAIKEEDFPLVAYSLSFPHPTTKEWLCFKMEVTNEA